MMHNDNDGAVPWYQGIEYFMALRRLDKPVWMLVYNNEAHNLRKICDEIFGEENAIDTFFTPGYFFTSSANVSNFSL